MLRTADWKDLQEGRLLICRTPNRMYKHYGKLATVSKVDNSEFRIIWSESDLTIDTIRQYPHDFQVVETSLATKHNWRKGGSVLCVYDNAKYGCTAIIEEDNDGHTGTTHLKVRWDISPEEADDDWGSFSSFVVFERPIEDAPATLPTGKIPVSTPDEIIERLTSQKAELDWDVYHGFKKPKRPGGYL